MLEVVKAAVEKVGTDFEDVVTETLRMGYDIPRVIYVAEALKTVLTGESLTSNKRVCSWHEPVEKPQNDYHLELSRKWNAANRDKRMARYSRLQEQGICTRCGKRKAVQGQTLCHICRENQRQYEARRDKAKTRDKERYYEYKRLGLCTKCGKPAVNGTTVCEKHSWGKRNKVS